MATMLLSAAGASVGGAVGGSVLGMASSTLFKTAGAIAGGLIDQQILGRGSAPVEAGRVERFRLQGASEGAPVPQLWGRMRLGGQLIWSSRFKEHVDESRQGGKGGGQKVREYSYTISFAVALCEGAIKRIGRVWADGNEISLGDFQHRLYGGGAAQEPDPLIDAIEGGAPAFRNTAYVVFEDFPLGAFGNRIPQLNFEAFREPPSKEGDFDPAEYAPALSDLVKGVAMSPGSGEFSLETRKTRRLIGPGQTVYENVNTRAERPDFLLGLEQLGREAPVCDAVSLVVSWFGDDLRCGRCRIEPRVENHEKVTEPGVWRSSGLDRKDARLVSFDAEGRPVFGGTPSDESVIRAIQAIKAEGKRVLFYPFILMDVPPNNGKRDPWDGSANQPVYPWRGRITLDDAPGQTGSADKSTAAAEEVADFFGVCAASDFSPGSDGVDYAGPAEWSMRRFILHYAHLCAAAGGVDAFCIGSEMRSLTQIRSSSSHYPAVAKFRALAGDVRGILGGSTKIGYAADWSEYFGHHPGDGSSDVFFHLDPLWADEDIDFVGIDNYLPLADWRYREGHADEDAGSVYSLAYLRRNVAGGEGYNWYYAGAAARDAQTRTPIVDTAHGEDWVFRPKDIAQWWKEPHHNRPGGVRSASPTAWVPRGKPIYFTEIGCPAVDLGANQPNVFVDPKSSESFLPYYSQGVRDDYMQRRYLQASLSYWEDASNNLWSGVYGGRMIDMDNVYVWTWDARPWPDFPDNREVWSDGENHRLGHWVTGRLGSAALAEVVAEICRSSGLYSFDVSALRGVVHGYVRDDARTGREALQPLMMAFDFDAVESGGKVRFVHRGGRALASVKRGDMAIKRDAAVDLEFFRSPEGETPRAVRLAYVDGEREYEPGAVEATAKASSSTRVETASAPVVLDSGLARTAADRFLRAARAGREGVVVATGRRLIELEPGDVISVDGGSDTARYRIDSIDDGLLRRATLSRIENESFVTFPRKARRPRRSAAAPAAPVESTFLDLPFADAGAKIAAFATPWTGAVSVYGSPDGVSFNAAGRIGRPAVMGELTTDLPKGRPDVWTRGDGMTLRLFGGALEARSELAVLNGENLAALESPSGDWEIIQFQGAELIGENLWRMTRLLRGRRGTDAYIGDPTLAGARFVLLNDALAELSLAPLPARQERQWLIGPSRKPYSDESYQSFSAAWKDAGSRPFAPVRLRSAFLPNGDIRFSWVRRSRLDADAWSGPDAPLGEGREAYAIRVGETRTETVGGAEWIYDAAARATDGLSGAAEIGVAQISETYGPGPEARITINV